MWDEISYRLLATLELTTLALRSAITLAIFLRNNGGAAAWAHGGPPGAVIRFGGQFIAGVLAGAIFRFLLLLLAGLGAAAHGADCEQCPTAAHAHPIPSDRRSAHRAVGNLAFRQAQLILPVCTLAFIITAPIMRTVRECAEALASPYVRCAEAHGLRRLVVEPAMCFATRAWRSSR